MSHAPVVNVLIGTVKETSVLTPARYTMEIIPQNCLSFLPFIPEAVSSWSDTSDLLAYLYCLFDKTGVAVDDKGVEHQLHYFIYGKYIYETGKDQFQEVCIEFLTNAHKAGSARDATGKAEPIPDFWDDTNFGMLAKYYVAWNGTIREVLQGGGFFSLTHTLESMADLDCSILLASNIYYKQALQVLRNFLEGVVLQLYFCDNEAAFVDWKADLFRVPSFRGRNGMLEHLHLRGLLSDDLVHTASNLYGDLSGSIHGVESRLIHRGSFTGEWVGLSRWT